MTNLDWIRTLSAKELSELLYDYWLPRGQYVWTDSRKGLTKVLGENYLERDCNKCKHQGSCYCVKGLGCPFEPKDEPQTQLTAKCLECNNSKTCKENHWKDCRYEPLGYEVTAVVGTIKDEPQTTDYCDGCNHKGCDNCIADGSNPYCVPSHYEPQTEVKGSERCLKSSEQSDAPILTASGWKRIKEAMPECRLILFDDDGNCIEPQTERSE